MSQINYDFNLLNLLFKNKNHIRGFAKQLGTNQTTISRKIYELYEQNIVDYHQEGKNKVFFLKKTLEAKESAYLMEIHNLIETIHQYQELRRIIERIQKNKQVTLALLFGSYAKGNAHKESDIDIYVETKKKSIKEEIELIDNRIHVKIGAYDKQNLLIKEIDRNHVIIKGLEEYYEKNKFFD